MPIVQPFLEIDELQSTDMVFGTQNGIDSLYKVYAEKSVRVDKGNKGADFAIKQSVLNKNTKNVPTDPNKLSQATYSAEGIKRNQEYLNAFPQLPAKYVNSITAKESITTGNSRMIRRKCKSILYWQLIVNSLRVQFVVSGLDLKAVPNKQIRLESKETIEYSEKGASSKENNKDKAITDAELRWVFRNREVAQVQKGVQFWKSSTTVRYGPPIPCAAPWDMPEYQAAWKEYGLRIEERAKIKQTAIEELDGYIMGELGMMG